MEATAAAAAAAAPADTTVFDGADVIIVVVAPADTGSEWIASTSCLIGEEIRVSRITGSPARCGVVVDAAAAQIGVAKCDAVSRLLPAAMLMCVGAVAADVDPRGIDKGCCCCG